MNIPAQLIAILGDVHAAPLHFFFGGGDFLLRVLGSEAALIGTVQAEPPGMVFLRTEIGGMRVLDMLVGDPLPRIC